MLHQGRDFPDLLVTAGDVAGTNPALVEKDYWVTQVLRVIAADYSGGTVFKGGTSLSKAWGLIQRFSEDIDLLIRQDTESTETGGARDRYMKAIQARVGEIDGLESTTGGARSERGISRTAVFTYEPRTTLLEGLHPTVILEMGIRGGAHPTEQRRIESILGSVLDAVEPGHDELAPFEMTVLHARRTLVEKLAALHTACSLWEEGRQTALQRQSRHLYDVYYLLGDEQIAAFVGSGEYRSLVQEIDEFARKYFERDHRTPPDMTFEHSLALSPTGELLAAIQDDYERSSFLFYGEAPSLETIYERIKAARPRL